MWSETVIYHEKPVIFGDSGPYCQAEEACDQENIPKWTFLEMGYVAHKITEHQKQWFTIKNMTFGDSGPYSQAEEACDQENVPK